MQPLPKLYVSARCSAGHASICQPNEPGGCLKIRPRKWLTFPSGFLGFSLFPCGLPFKPTKRKRGVAPQKFVKQHTLAAEGHVGDAAARKVHEAWRLSKPKTGMHRKESSLKGPGPDRQVPYGEDLISGLHVLSNKVHTRSFHPSFWEASKIQLHGSPKHRTAPEPQPIQESPAEPPCWVNQVVAASTALPEQSCMLRNLSG